MKEKEKCGGYLDEVGFSENAWEEYLFWQKTDKKILNRIN
jgi:Txe/YoeB family toxin of Txe-Axe toxin-antitoxin module